MQSLMNMWASFTAKDMLSLVSIAMAVVGISLAVYFYFKQKQTRAPCYSSFSSQIISRQRIQPHNLVVSLNGVEVHDLVVTRIAFWNGGNVSIKRGDCVGAHCVRVLSSQTCKILNAAVVSSSAEESGLQVSYDQADCSINIDFAFLRATEGFVLTVAHEGTVIEKLSIDVSLIDGRTLAQIPTRSLTFYPLYPSPRLSNEAHKRLRRILPMVLMCFGLCVAVAAVGEEIFVEKWKLGEVIAVVLVGALYAWMGWMTRNRLPGKLANAYFD